MDKKRIRNRVFSILLIVGTVAVIYWVLSVPPPNRRRTSPKNICINNLRQIDGAKEQWALDNQRLTSSVVSSNEVDAYIKGGFPQCPAGGRYTLGRIGESPTCTVSGHSLP